MPPVRTLIKITVGLTVVMILVLGIEAIRHAVENRAILRTVIVVDASHLPADPAVLSRVCGPSPRCQNGANGIDIVDLIGGHPPATPTTANVVADSNCDPDADGISHCLNILKLRDGTILTVRHAHNMHLYPCLTPGEVVRVTAPRSM